MNRTSTPHRLRIAGIGLCLGGVAVSAWSGAISVRAANAGDMFIQTAGAAAPSGNSNDPQLACADIDLWGSGLTLSSSTFTISGVAPTGAGEAVYSGTWSYNSGTSDPQIVATVPETALIDAAAAAGDTPAANGYHFEIDWAQNSKKSKTFWMHCPAPSTDPGSGSSGGGTTTTTSSSTMTSSSISSSTTTTTDSSSTGTDPGTTTSSSSSSSSSSAAGTTSDSSTTTDAGTTTSGSSTTTDSSSTSSAASGSTSTQGAPLVQISTSSSTSTSTQSSSAGTSSAGGASGVNGLSDGSPTIGSTGSGSTTSTGSTSSSAAGGNIGVAISSPAPAPAPAPAPVPASAPALPTAASAPPAPNTGADVPFGMGLLLLIGGAGTILVSSALRRRRVD
ncbi:MAG TPA: hypothetical protein VF112_08525 [Candidatus Dormibacteraeota bacterium]